MGGVLAFFYASNLVVLYGIALARSTWQYVSDGQFLIYVQCSLPTCPRCALHCDHASPAHTQASHRIAPSKRINTTFKSSTHRAPRSTPRPADSD